MSGSDGSTALDSKQQKWFRKKFGVTYLHVQTNADMPNRKARRDYARSTRRRPDGAPFGGHVRVAK